MKIVYTKKDLLRLLSEFGIEKGMSVLVQGQLDGFDIIGSQQAFIEALMELVGPEGCIIMPTFTYSCLDPACYEQKQYSYDSWQSIRENSLGYDSKLTSSDIYPSLTNQFLKNEGVIRTLHPVYSFAYWGTYNEKCLDQPLNFPISFSRVLRCFWENKSVNLLINEDINHSLLFPAIAKTMNQGIVEEKRGIIKRNHSNSLKMFLNIRMDNETTDEYKDMCSIQSKEYQNKWIHVLSLDTNEDNE